MNVYVGLVCLCFVGVFMVCMYVAGVCVCGAGVSLCIVGVFMYAYVCSHNVYKLPYFSGLVSGTILPGGN